ncbi:adenine phosphoribosyltransferase [Candidatus Peribacteria bacterium RIFCSPLOWO2_12_FULL_55_15]|nr:MAG: adenine phosphoribosyltransferase [Candidatus Peribacteria bacterium RIFCSPHIGHO2_01_FULL_54_22]OGJ62304.1 MAG: adenine phosphoribosyltransferase [Candidatus Peribacteria bacterium RIFCSPHIGHO2_02_FULL_55_24]OGJ64663.1 MAG: adenine phosphoribosyltransferase [Candidatus Peribacteria bacterium RIFCSPHIGHO2_12_FULL_54_10]OGJ67741.1 MAG: adenine phosphoribosyltransferase [Candidatus Peribacteria bacterium RIFCSPLOWO2_01_FULL_54_110]OGJ68885.1 MAG: adenine phosphoribosyltransferase [Candidat
MNLRPFIHRVPDFPIKGITFWDIMDLLRHPEAFGWTVEQFAKQFKDNAIDTVAAPESRGFLFGCPVAKELGIGFVPIRKPGKLPRQTIQERCTLEYGVTTMEMHEDAISPGERVLLIDDVLATGGTALACASLIERQGGIVAGMGFLLDLQYIPRKAALVPYETFSLLTFTEQDVHGKREIVAA